jgi:hypothetical protein
MRGRLASRGEVGDGRRHALGVVVGLAQGGVAEAGEVVAGREEVVGGGSGRGLEGWQRGCCGGTLRGETVGVRLGRGMRVDRCRQVGDAAGRREHAES